MPTNAVDSRSSQMSVKYIATYSSFHRVSTPGSVCSDLMSVAAANPSR